MKLFQKRKPIILFQENLGAECFQEFQWKYVQQLLFNFLWYLNSMWGHNILY